MELVFFDATVLSAYHAEPDKYEITAREFEGTLRTTDGYTEECIDSGRGNDILSLNYGMAKLVDGRKAIVIPAYRVNKLSEPHASKWRGFYIHDAQPDPYDTLFSQWQKRYLEGDWSVEDDALSQVSQLLESINSMTEVSVGLPLYSSVFKNEVNFPVGQNTHQYEDAHRELYRYLIDGLNKDCIKTLADLLGKQIKIDSDNTRKALSKLFPSLEAGNKGMFDNAMEKISNNRRPSAHQARDKAVRFDAHDAFATDLQDCKAALEMLQGILQTETGFDPEKTLSYVRSKVFFPKVGVKPQPNYSINKARQMKGKTIDRVEYGFEDKGGDGHNTEMMILYFSDGSAVGITTGCNFETLCTDENELQPSDFQVNLHVQWLESKDNLK
jgi:hypothetical protein